MNLPAIREKSKKNMTRGKKQALMAGVCAGLIALTAVVNGLLTNSVRSGREELQTAELFEGQGEDQAQHAANEPVSAGTEQTESGEDDYFAVFRQDREETREKELAYLQEIIETAGTDEETLAAAQDSRLFLIEAMEMEMTVENLLRAKGFSDAAVTVHDDSVTVVVDAEALTDGEVAKILDIACDETGQEARNVKIMSLN